MHTMAPSTALHRAAGECSFISNNRGIDNNKDIPREVLTQIYNSITSNEIKLSDNAAGAAAGNGLIH